MTAEQAQSGTEPKTLLLLHGMWGGPWMWDLFVPWFEARGYRCIVPTLRHHDVAPGTPPPPELATTSLTDYVDDLAALIGELDTPPIVVGHSMGGLLAQLLAAKGLASRLVLLTPAAPAGVNGVTISSLRTTLSLLLTWRFWTKPILLTAGEASYGLFNLLPAEEHAETYARFVHESGLVGLECGLWELDKSKASRVDPASVTCPVLLVAAQFDRITPPSVVRKVAAFYGESAALVELEGASHWLIREAGWERAAEQVHGWLAEGS